MSIYLDNDIDYYKSELKSKDQQIKELTELFKIADNILYKATEINGQDYDRFILQKESYKQKSPNK